MSDAASVRKELKGAQVALWVLVVGEVFASFAHVALYLASDMNHQGGDGVWFALPGGAFSIVGALVLLYFVAAIERVTSTLADIRGGLVGLTVLGALGCILGVRVLTDFYLLTRVRRHVADAIAFGGAGVPGDQATADRLRSRMFALIAVRSVVQVVGVIPALALVDQFRRGDAGALDWLAVSVAPFLSLVLVVVVAWKVTQALQDAFGRPALGALSGAVSVAVPTTRES